MEEPSARLQRLVDEDALDELLSIVTLEEIADAWWRHQAREFGEHEDRADDPDWWAVELWILGLPSDEVRRAGLRALADRAPEAADLGFLGAGPLESYVADDEDKIAWIEEQARVSPNFRKALANVWAWDLPPQQFLRLERAAGAKLAWPKREEKAAPERRVAR